VDPDLEADRRPAVAAVVGPDHALRVSGTVTAYALANAASALIVQVFLTPVTIATVVAIYIDLRARKEPDQQPSAALATDRSVPPPALGDVWS
jgi:hypothetical protein